jgi:hypothetical protein
MNRPTEKLFIRPLFYDALSGEFSPPTDPLNRKHTLGRLAVATFIKGGSVSENYVVNGFQATPVIQYKPSWAEKVSSTISLEVDKNTMVHSLTQLDLRTSDRGLTVIDMRRGNKPRGIVLISNEGDQILPLDLDENLDAARLAVSEEAQKIFDSVLS